MKTSPGTGQGGPKLNSGAMRAAGGPLSPRAAAASAAAAAAATEPVSGELAAMTAEEAERRVQRRSKWEAEQEAGRRWDLQRHLADISTDVEFLAREVRREGMGGSSGEGSGGLCCAWGVGGIGAGRM